jgi:hypothetical protein
MKAGGKPPLSRALRDLAAEDEADFLADPRWDRLADGTASAADLAALAVEAEGDPAREEALALFTPLGSDAKERYLAAIAAVSSAGEAAAPDAAPAPAPAPDAAPAPAPAPDAAPAPAPAPDAPAPAPDVPTNVRALSLAAPRRPRRAFVGMIAGGLALAAAVSLVVLRRPAPGELPAYALSWSGGEGSVRGEPPAETPALRRGTPFVIALRPASPAGAVEVRAFLVQGARVTPLDVEARVSPDGAVRLTGRIGDGVALTPGDAEIAVVIARPEAAEKGAAALAPAPGRQVQRRRVRLVEGP